MTTINYDSDNDILFRKNRYRIKNIKFSNINNNNNEKKEEEKITSITIKKFYSLKIIILLFFVMFICKILVK